MTESEFSDLLSEIRKKRWSQFLVYHKGMFLACIIGFVSLLIAAVIPPFGLIAAILVLFPISLAFSAISRFFAIHKECSFFKKLYREARNSVKFKPSGTPPTAFQKRYKSHISIDCPNCQTSLKLPSPITHGKIRCAGCSILFSVILSENGSLKYKLFPMTDRYAETKPWYIVLAVDPEASINQIKKAYRTRISEYHPDKVAHLGRDLKILAEQKAREINDAYETALSKYN